jgi:hypothetical protein
MARKIKDKLVALATGAALLAGVNNSNADILKVNINGVTGGVTSPDPVIELRTGGSDIYAPIEDASYNPVWTAEVNAYSVVDGHNLIVNVLSAGFSGTVPVKISGTSLSGIVNPKLSPQIQTDNGAFTNKNIYGDVYAVTNGVRAGLVRTDDWKTMASTNGV